MHANQPTCGFVRAMKKLYKHSDMYCYMCGLLEIGWWTMTPICKDTRLCHFCSYNAVENEASFVLECPLYNPNRKKSPSLFENIVLGSLESFFQLDQQVNISLCLTEATTLRHSTKLIGLKSSWYTFNLIRLFSFPDFDINFILFIAMSAIGKSCRSLYPLKTRIR